MKKLLLILGVIILASCGETMQQKQERLKLQYNSIEINNYHQILTIENHRYLIGYQAGALHLESCQCKTK